LGAGGRISLFTPQTWGLGGESPFLFPKIGGWGRISFLFPKIGGYKDV